MKSYIKKILGLAGILHPAGGAKISAARKIEILRSYKTPSTPVFIETGTEFGGTIDGLRDLFDRVYSVELDEKLYKRASQLFKDDPRIRLCHGDSSTMMKKILEEVHGPALIWLDAHRPGEITLENSPVRGELAAIFAHPSHHRILIDDARHFSRAAIRYLRRAAQEHGYTYELKEGLFRLT